jgi:hypothetical protein
MHSTALHTATRRRSPLSLRRAPGKWRSECAHCLGRLAPARQQPALPQRHPRKWTQHQCHCSACLTPRLLPHRLWRQWPLPPALATYAADDVRYLLPLALKLLGGYQEAALQLSSVYAAAAMVRPAMPCPAMVRSASVPLQAAPEEQLPVHRLTWPDRHTYSFEVHQAAAEGDQAGEGSSGVDGHAEGRLAPVMAGDDAEDEDVCTMLEVLPARWGIWGFVKGTGWRLRCGP